MNPLKQLAIEVEQSHFNDLLCTMDIIKEIIQPDGLIIIGSHQSCDGLTGLIHHNCDGESKYYVVQPHSRCDSQKCLQEDYYHCSGRDEPLPEAMLTTSIFLQ